MNVFMTSGGFRRDLKSLSLPACSFPRRHFLSSDGGMIDENDKHISSKGHVFFNESVVNSTTMKEGVRFEASVLLTSKPIHFAVKYADTQPNKVERVIYYFSGRSVLERFLVDASGDTLPWRLERVFGLLFQRDYSFLALGVFSFLGLIFPIVIINVIKVREWLEKI